MYLGYLDDSEQGDWMVVGSTLMPANSSMIAEMHAALAIENLMPEEERHRFTEFHASELYNGTGTFEGILQSSRFAAIANLLKCLNSCNAKIAYGAINLPELRKGSFGSANVRDVAFRRCVLGIEDWLWKMVLGEMGKENYGSEYTAMFIMDEVAQSDKQTRYILQSSFRSLRSRFRFSAKDSGQISFVHEDMYFGDSRYSVGIQLADLCSYFVGRHLCGKEDSEGFYGMIEPFIVSTGKEE